MEATPWSSFACLRRWRLTPFASARRHKPRRSRGAVPSARTCRRGGPHVDLEQEQIVVSLGRAQPCGPFGGFPVGDAGVVEAAGDQHRWGRGHSLLVTVPSGKSAENRISAAAAKSYLEHSA